MEYLLCFDLIFFSYCIMKIKVGQLCYFNFHSRSGPESIVIYEDICTLIIRLQNGQSIFSQPHCIVEKGRVLPCIRAARRRGIRFDVGHGTSAFCFAVARAACKDGFLPDTVSTDLQRFHIDQATRHDLPTVMSELRAASMPENEVFAAVTSRPASLLQLDDFGVLRVDAVADLTVLQAGHQEPFADATRPANVGPAWTAALVVKGGHIITTK